MSDDGSSMVSIPDDAKKVVQDIKEISTGHTDEEIYAMLMECSMDANETVQKLLLQDPFHEVKKKRDRKKENFNGRAQQDSRWRPPMNGRRSYTSNNDGAEESYVLDVENEITPVSGDEATSAFSSGSREVEGNFGISHSSDVSSLDEAKHEDNSPIGPPLSVMVGNIHLSLPRLSPTVEMLKSHLLNRPQRFSRGWASSRYEGRSAFNHQRRVAPHKVWRPKSTPVNADASSLQLRLDDLHLSDDEHAIIPTPQHGRDGKCSIMMRDTSQVNQHNIKSSPSRVDKQKYILEEPHSRSETIEVKRDHQENVEEQHHQEAHFSVIQAAPYYSSFRAIPSTFAHPGILSPDSSSSSSFAIQQPFDSSAGYYMQAYQPASDANSGIPQFPSPPKNNVAAVNEVPNYAQNYIAYPIFYCSHGMAHVLGPSFVPPPPAVAPTNGNSSSTASNEETTGIANGNASFYVPGPQCNTPRREMPSAFYSFPQVHPMGFGVVCTTAAPVQMMAAPLQMTAAQPMQAADMPSHPNGIYAVSWNNNY